MNTKLRSTPELTIGGVRISNVADEPQPQVSMAADLELTEAFVRAVDAQAGAIGGGGRVLIVNDISCGALPMRLARAGYAVDLVNDDEAIDAAARAARAWAEAGRLDLGRVDEVPRRCPQGHECSCAVANDLASARGDDTLECNGCECELLPSATRYSCVECDYDACPQCAAEPRGRWAGVGRVATERGGRITRGIFVPTPDYSRCYGAVLFPSACLDALRGDETKLAAANAVARMWLLEEGVRIPVKVCVEERAHAFDFGSFYLASLPDQRLVKVWRPRPPPVQDL